MGQIATCTKCGTFKVPWGDHIGVALMHAHLAECKGAAKAPALAAQEPGQ